MESIKIEKIEGWFNPDTDNTSLTDLFKLGNFISTGLASIDQALNDLAPGCVTVVAGRSNGGKSTFVNQIVANAIEVMNKTLLISGEDDKRLLLNKIYTAVIGSNPKLYDNVQINKRWFKTPKPAVVKMLKEWHKDKLSLYMKGEGSLKTTEELFKMVSEKIKVEGYNLIVIDNLMSVLSVKSADNKYEAQADFVQKCCDISKLYHCHIVIVLHPNKTYKKGDMMDFEQISGSSDISNKADSIIAITREYGEDENASGVDGYCEILKNRYFSDLKKIPLKYDKETGLLLELDEYSGTAQRYSFNIDPKNYSKRVKAEEIPWGR